MGQNGESRGVRELEVTCWQVNSVKGVVELEMFVQAGPIVVGRLTMKTLSAAAAQKLVGELHTRLSQQFGGVVRI